MADMRTERERWNERRDGETASECISRLIQGTALWDLKERLDTAQMELFDLLTRKPTPAVEEQTRLRGKRQGVLLALSYIEEALRG